MNNPPIAINLENLGVKANKDITHSNVLSLYKVHRAGSSHGVGVIATRNIAKDEEVIRVIGPMIGPEAAGTLYGSYGIDVTIQVGKDRWILPNNETRFLNHSCEPNMGFSGNGVFIAIRKIYKGEELTFDYSTSEVDPDWEINCLCGTPSCRKVISGNDMFDESLGLAKKYKGYLPPFVVKEISKRSLLA